MVMFSCDYMTDFMPGMSGRLTAAVAWLEVLELTRIQDQLLQDFGCGRDDWGDRRASSFSSAR
jgi:hypothetical protein